MFKSRCFVICALLSALVFFSTVSLASDCRHHPAGKLLNQYINLYNKRQLKPLLNLFSTHARTWGTASDEYVVGRNGIKRLLLRDWSQSETGKIRLITPVYCSKKNPTWAAARFDAIMTINGKPYHFHDLRADIVVAKEKNRWKIIFDHASFPNNVEAVGQSFPAPYKQTAKPRVTVTG